MIALAYAGGLGLLAVLLFTAAALASMSPRLRVPLLAGAFAIAAMIATALMVVFALFGALELSIGALS